MSWPPQLSAIPGSTLQSRWRNLFSGFAVVASVLLFVEYLYAANDKGVLTDRAAGIVLVTISAIYFAVVIGGVLFLVATKYGVAPLRLARDGALSVIFNLLAFSVLYRTSGIGLEACPGFTPEAGSSFSQSDPTASLYFSMVTFSTLGYGDFRPCDATRLWAAAQAILGNLHLAIIVASAFLVADAARNNLRTGTEEATPTHPDEEEEDKPAGPASSARELRRRQKRARKRTRRRSQSRPEA